MQRAGKALSALGNFETAVGLFTGSSVAVKLLSDMIGIGTPLPMLWAVFIASVSGGLVVSHVAFRLFGTLRRWANPSVLRVETHGVERIATLTLHRKDGPGSELFWVTAQLRHADGTNDGPPVPLVWPHRGQGQGQAIYQYATLTVAYWDQENNGDIVLHYPGGRTERLAQKWTGPPHLLCRLARAPDRHRRCRERRVPPVPRICFSVRE